MANTSNEETIEDDDAASGQDQPQLLMVNDTIEIDQSPWEHSSKFEIANGI